MKPVFIIALYHLRLISKEKSTLLYMVLLPLLYIVVFGNAFRSGGDASQQKSYLGIYNQDQGFLAQRFIRSIASENIQLDSLTTMPEDTPTRMLVIPAEFTQKLLSGEQVTLVLKKKQDANLEAEAAASMAIRKAYFRILADLTELVVNDKELNTVNVNKLSERPPLVIVESRFAGRHVIIPSGYNQQVPGNIVMFTLMILFMYAGSILQQEKNTGLLRRLRVAPVAMSHIYWGKLIGVAGVGFVQIGILLLAGRFIFGVYYGSSPFSLLLLVVLYTFTVAPMALSLGFIIKNEEKLIAISITSALVLSALGGCMFPLEIAPRWMNSLANFLPSGLAVKAFHRLISYGYGFQGVWMYLAGLAIFAVVFSLVSARLLYRFEKSL